MLGKLLPCRIPKRFIIVLMVFIGYINFFGLHANIGMAVVEMTSSAKNFIHENGTMEKRVEYDWNSKQKALVLSCFAYGRLLGPIGGILAGQFGGSTVYASGILMNAVVTTFTPFFLHINFYLFVITTALTGVFESFAYASVSQLWSRWLLPEERAKCISFTIIGVEGGAIASFIVSGWILSVWGWEMLFYASGIATFIWFCLWCLVVKNDPSVDKHMSHKERKYIQTKLNLETASHTEKLVYPWKHILTSLPFWSVCLCKFCSGCGYTINVMYLPQYIKDTNDIDIKNIGLISVIPHLSAAITLPLVGWTFDYIRTREILTLTNVHKLYVGIGLFSGTIAYMVAGLWSNFIVCIICMTLFQILIQCTVMDIQVSLLDLAPRYAAFMNAVATCCFSTATFLTPVFVGFYVTSHSQLEWSVCFLIISIVYTSVALIFLRFGSGELQPWANYRLDKHEDENPQN